MTWQILSVVPVWIASAVAAVIIGTIGAPEKHVTWLAITLAAAVIATFLIQLGIHRKDGFLLRVFASIGGSVIVLALATGILAFVG